MSPLVRVVLPVFVAATLLVTGCAKSPKSNDTADKPLGRGGLPPAEVLTIQAARREFSNSLEAVGTALARESVTLTSKSANTISAIKFTEGQRVAAGTVLVELDRAQRPRHSPKRRPNCSRAKPARARARPVGAPSIVASAARST